MRMSETTAIPDRVRKRVMERDSWDETVCCVLCGRPKYVELHHLILRSEGGKGIEENLLCLCPACHRYWHDTHDPETKEFFKEYLKAHYENWDERKLK